LIVNEALTNAAKYGFSDDAAGNVRSDLHAGVDQAKLLPASIVRGSASAAGRNVIPPPMVGGGIIQSVLRRSGGYAIDAPAPLILLGGDCEPPRARIARAVSEPTEDDDFDESRVDESGLFAVPGVAHWHREPPTRRNIQTIIFLH
jgi:hypothetical protein